MAVNPALYQELARALSQPSKAYQATQEALNIPKQAIEGYKYGADFGDSLRKRKLEQQTLSEALGGQPPEEGLMNLTGESGAIQHPALSIWAAMQKANRTNTPKPVNKQQANFLVGGKLMTFDPVSGTYSPAPISGNGKDGDITPRVAPTVPSGETEFFGKADTLNSILGDVKKSFRPDYVGPVAGRVGKFIDVNTPYGDDNRSHFRNQVAKAFNNLVYLRSGKQINEEEAHRLADEFITTNNSPVAFQSGLSSMQDEMNSLVANRRKALAQAGYRGAGGLSAGTNAPEATQGNSDPLGLFK